MTTEQEFQLSEYDVQLIDDCLEGKPHAWENFVDRFLVPVTGTVNHTLMVRGIEISLQEKENLIHYVFENLHQDHFALLKKFHGQAEFTTFLTVLTRRLVVRSLVRKADLKFVEPTNFRIPDQPVNQTIVETQLETTSGQTTPETISFEEAKVALESQKNEVEQEQAGRRIVEMLASLSQAEQKIVQMHFSERLEINEIAKQLEMTTTEVETAIEKAASSTRSLWNSKKAA